MDQQSRVAETMEGIVVMIGNAMDWLTSDQVVVVVVVVVCCCCCLVLFWRMETEEHEHHTNYRFYCKYKGYVACTCCTV